MTSTDRQSAAGAALLEWMNSFRISEGVGSLNNLNDGHKIWEVLNAIEPNYFKGSLPEGPSSSRKWDLRWVNLKHINRKLSSYVTNECRQTIPKGLGMADLKTMAMGGNRGETIKLLKLILFAALNCANATQYIQKMQSLTFETQKSLKDMIEDMQPASYPTSEVERSRSDGAISPTKGALDPELILEEKLGEAIAGNAKLSREKKDMQKELRDLNGRLAHLQESNTVLQDQLTQAQDQLKSSDSMLRAREESHAKNLKLQDQDGLIANLEGQLRHYQNKLEDMQKTHENLRKTHERSQPLRDELREVTFERDSIQRERDSLLKKANIVDKYKLKLQANQNLEKENELLREELEAARSKLKQVDQTRQQAPGLQKQVEEYEEILPQLERDRHELQVVKVQLELDKAVLAQRMDEANAKQAKDHETIAELEEKLRSFESLQIQSVENVHGLEEELENGETRENVDTQPQVAASPLKWSRLTSASRNLDLKDKNDTLSKASDEINANFAILQKMLKDGKGNAGDLKILQTIEAAMAGHEETQGFQGAISLEKHISDLATIITDGRDDLAKQTEVQRSLLYNTPEGIFLFSRVEDMPTRSSLDMFKA